MSEMNYNTDEDDQWNSKGNYPHPPFIDTTPDMTSPIYMFKWPFLWHLKVSGLKKDLLQRGHTNPTPKCTLLMCAQMVAWKVDGPSLQP